jgi:hypothetical protein
MQFRVVIDERHILALLRAEAQRQNASIHHLHGRFSGDEAFDIVE